VDGDDGDEGGVDAAGERDEGAFEAALVGVVAEAEDEGGEGVLAFVLGEGGREEWRVESGGLRAGRRRAGEVDDAEVFGEGGEAGAEFAAGVANEAASVEDELVVAADGVDVGDGAVEGAGGVGDEGLADVAFVVVPGGWRKG